MVVASGAKVRDLSAYAGWPLVTLFVLDVFIAVAYVWGGWKWVALPNIPLSTFGGLLGVAVGFRNSTAYARWWEARIIWGSVVNNSRNFARGVLAMIAGPETDGSPDGRLDEIRRKLVRLQIAYVRALRNHLRGTAPWRDLECLIPQQDLEALKNKNNVPVMIQQAIARSLAECYQLGWLDSVRWTTIDGTLSELMGCQGAAERIKNTPMPCLYDAFIRAFIRLYCVLLPLGMVQSLGMLTPFGSTLVGFVFMALDKIGRDLEDPFENRPHDIPLTAICTAVEINLKQMIDDEAPEPLAPVDGILW